MQYIDVSPHSIAVHKNSWVPPPKQMAASYGILKGEYLRT